MPGAGKGWGGGKGGGGRGGGWQRSEIDIGDIVSCSLHVPVTHTMSVTDDPLR